MRYPSIKTIQEKLSLDRVSAKCIRGLMNRSVSPEGFGAVQKWLKQCYHRPNDNELIMCAINEVLETFGVEAIEGKWIDYYYQNIRAVYCNTGDTYATTVLFCHKREKFMIISYGDYVEMEQKFL